MAKIKVTLVKSTIGSTESQKATVAALGLKKIRDEKIHEDCATINGMIAKVNHLIKVEPVKKGGATK